MAKITVRMLSRATHPGGVYHPGEVYAIDEKQAEDFLAGGYAERVSPNAPAAPPAESSPLRDGELPAREIPGDDDQGDEKDARPGKKPKKGGR